MAKGAGSGAAQSSTLPGGASFKTVAAHLGRAAFDGSDQLEELAGVALELLPEEGLVGRKALQSLAIGELKMPLLHYLVLMKESGLGSLQLLVLSPWVDKDQEDVEGVTPLFRAIQTRNIEAARALIDAGARLDSGYFTPLAFAAQTGMNRMVSSLLRAGARPTVPSGPRLLTPSVLAARAGRRKIASALVQQEVVQAVRSGRIATLRGLMDRGGKLYPQCVEEAILYGHPQMADLLLRSGVAPGRALLAAATVGDAHSAAVLLKHRRDKKALPLNRACSKGHAEIAQLFIDHGAVVEDKHFLGAVNANSLATLNVLTAGGRRCPVSALAVALFSDRFEMVSSILESGLVSMDEFVQTGDAAEVIGRCVDEGDSIMMQTLMENGLLASVERMGDLAAIELLYNDLGFSYGRLHDAANNADVKGVGYALKYGCDVNEQIDGQSPLHAFLLGLSTRAEVTKEDLRVADMLRLAGAQFEINASLSPSMLEGMREAVERLAEAKGPSEALR